MLTQGPLFLPATAQGPAIPEVSIRAPVPATAQGTAGTVMSSQDTLSPAGCSGTQRTCGITSEPTAPLQASPVSTGPAVSIHDPMTTTCPYSVSLGTCGVLTRLPAPCRLLRDQQVLWCWLGALCPLQSAQGTTGPVLCHLLRNPNDL